MQPPLAGINVLDFSHALAGPFCTLLLSDYGANVYKIESPEGGDMGRGWAPPMTGDHSSYFIGPNRGKESIALNLKDPRGVSLCLDLMQRADVVIENFRPGTVERLGIGYTAARARNERIVYCSISGYGQEGPARDQSAMDLILQASSGLISVTGTENGEQVRCGHSVADITAGMFALIGILMALRARDQFGVGQYIDVAMLDSMISAMSSVFANYLGSEIVPRPLGTAFATIVPYRTFATQDRDIAVAVGSEKLWAGFCKVVDRPELIGDPKFATNPLRVKNRRELEPMLAEIFAQQTSAYWERKLSSAGIPCAPVRTVDQVVNDAQAILRGMFPSVNDPTAGRLPITGLPIKLSTTPGRVLHPAPYLGQHTFSALSRLLGLHTPTLESLVSGGVIHDAGKTSAPK